MTFDGRYGLQRQASGLAISSYQSRWSEFNAAEIADDAYNNICQSKRINLPQYRTSGSAGWLAVILSQTTPVTCRKSPAHMPRIMIAVTQRLHIHPRILLAVNVMRIRYETAQLFSELALTFLLYCVICVGHKSLYGHICIHVHTSCPFSTHKVSAFLL